jgi:anti-sigma regulatory factor (Ser/Thr protein kinase)
VVSPSGEPSFLEQPEGLPLGLRSSVSYSSRRYGFPPGSALVLYTDGLVERRGEPIDAGLERLADVAAGEADANGMILADSIYGALVDEAALDDDVALLVVESIPLGDEIELTLEAEPGVLAGLRRTVERWLQSQGLREDERFNVTVAVSEAAGNAIEHAYGGRAATFSVSCERDSNGVRIAVRDSGRWRESRPVGRGRGLAIMRALVDSVDIRREAGGTTVTLSKHTNSEDR